MGLLETVFNLQRMANDAINDALNEGKVNDLTHYTKNGVTYIHVHDLSAAYKLKDGQWYELPPF